MFSDVFSGLWDLLISSGANIYPPYPETFRNMHQIKALTKPAKLNRQKAAHPSIVRLRNVSGVRLRIETGISLRPNAERPKTDHHLGIIKSPNDGNAPTAGNSKTGLPLMPPLYPYRNTYVQIKKEI